MRTELGMRVGKLKNRKSAGKDERMRSPER